ncbi:hypothetical protein [Weissella hellenica]|uniref:hypothetical protein n=1 Tax=Weissella hellenica TaxID=46256 RepID=UPI0038889FFD
MLKEQLSKKLELFNNQAIDDQKIDILLRPILVQGMQRGFQAAYLYIIGVSSGIEPAAQTAAWVDQIEALANERFTPFVAEIEQIKTVVGKEVVSMLSEEAHAITAHQDNTMKIQNFIMPYFNGWFLGYYHALLAMLAADDVTQVDKLDVQKKASDQAMQAVEVERRNFQKQPVYRDSVLRDILTGLQ